MGLTYQSEKKIEVGVPPTANIPPRKEDTPVVK